MAEPTLPSPGATTLRRRAVLAGVCVLLWTAAIEARLVYLQVVRHAELAARADRQQNAHGRRRRPSAARSSIATAACSPTASTSTASTRCRPRSATPAVTAQALCRALDDCDRGKLKALVERFSTARAFAYVERFVTPAGGGRGSPPSTSRASGS